MLLAQQQLAFRAHENVRFAPMKKLCEIFQLIARGRAVQPLSHEALSLPALCLNPAPCDQP